MEHEGPATLDDLRVALAGVIRKAVDWLPETPVDSELDAACDDAAVATLPIIEAYAQQRERQAVTEALDEVDEAILEFREKQRARLANHDCRHKVCLAVEDCARIVRSRREAVSAEDEAVTRG